MTIRLRRNTRQYFNDVALKGGFLEGEPLFITDEDRMAVATSPTSFIAVRKDTETTATSLATPRKINDTNFDGTADIVFPTTYDPGFQRIISPANAHYTTTGNQTGAIFVKFPVGFTSTMVNMTIKVYDYSVNGSYEVHCGGYIFAGGPNTWINHFAYIVGNNAVTANNFTVRFGRTTADNKPIIYIGETTTVHNYPQVFVTEVLCGYSGFSQNFLSGWQVGVTTSLENVTFSVTSPKV